MQRRQLPRLETMSCQIFDSRSFRSPTSSKIFVVHQRYSKVSNDFTRQLLHPRQHLCAFFLGRLLCATISPKYLLGRLQWQLHQTLDCCAWCLNCPSNWSSCVEFVNVNYSRRRKASLQKPAFQVVVEQLKGLQPHLSCSLTQMDHLVTGHVRTISLLLTLDFFTAMSANAAMPMDAQSPKPVPSSIETFAVVLTFFFGWRGAG